MSIGTKFRLLLTYQRLMGASLLVFKNKSDIGGGMDEEEIVKVSSRPPSRHFSDQFSAGIRFGIYNNPSLEGHDLQRYHWPKPYRRARMGSAGCKGSLVLVLMIMSPYHHKNDTTKDT